MKLSDEAVKEIEAEVKAAMAAPVAEKLAAGGISADSLCKNKTEILAFLEILIALIPGVIGKFAGPAIMVAARAWFKNKNC